LKIESPAGRMSGGKCAPRRDFKVCLRAGLLNADESK
jgi:hypothetical protein